jgi:uncharacterized protein YjbI with pentapeptide repeats
LTLERTQATITGQHLRNTNSIFVVLLFLGELEMTLSARAARLLVTTCGVVAFGVIALAATTSDAEVKQLKETRLCLACNLRGAFLDGANLSAVDVTGADFRDASLYTTILKGAELKDAIFIDANLNGANLTGAKHANLAGAKTNERTTCPDGKFGPCQ